MKAARSGTAEAQTALAQLCEDYYAPVHIYIAHSARDLGDARDLTQEFFARLLAGATFAAADRERGRFRAYLLGSVKHFLADTRERRSASKRGGRHEHVPLDAAADRSAAVVAPSPRAFESEKSFDRQWGISILSRALDELAAEHVQQGKGAHFDVLKPWLTGDAPSVSQADAATRLGVTEGAIKVAIHRLRRRFRELVRGHPADLMDDAPMRYRRAELSSSGRSP